MPIAEKEFVLKHAFEDVSSMKENEDKFSPLEDHFGIPWRLCVKRNADYLGLYFHCEKEKQEKEWSIVVRRELKVVSVNGKHFSHSFESIFQSTNEDRGRGCPEFMKWNQLMKDYVIDDTLNVEAHMKIKKMTGIEKKKLMNFDESMKEFSDVALIVEDQKFHVSKLFLARQSSFFNALLRGSFEEAKQDEVTLTGIKATDFQNFLEVLHGEMAIDEDTVAGILHLADMYDAKIVIKHCEEFLTEKSEKSAKEKLELAVNYKLNNLKNMCFLGIKTTDDIRSVLAGNLSKMDKDVLASLLQKSLAYQT